MLFVFLLSNGRRLSHSRQIRRAGVRPTRIHWNSQESNRVGIIFAFTWCSRTLGVPAVIAVRLSYVLVLIAPSWMTPILSGLDAEGARQLARQHGHFDTGWVHVGARRHRQDDPLYQGTKGWLQHLPNARHSCLPSIMLVISGQRDEEIGGSADQAKAPTPQSLPAPGARRPSDESFSDICTRPYGGPMDPGGGSGSARCTLPVVRAMNAALTAAACGWAFNSTGSTPTPSMVITSESPIVFMMRVAATRRRRGDDE